MIQVEGLTKRFGDTVAVDGVSFEVGEGQILVLLGSSGSGKTTTLKMLNRLVPPTAGRMTIAGQSVLELPPEQLRRRTGYVIQQIGLFPHLSVADNIGVVPKLLGWPKGKVKARAAELAELVGLPLGEYGHRYPHELSGGQQQRIGIARALAADPPVILMDEPFGALDPLIRSQLQHEFKHIQKQFNKTVVMVTHDVAEAMQLADNLALMHEGRLVQVGSPRALLFAPATDFVRQFFDSQRLQLELMVTTKAHIADFLGNGTTIKPAGGYVEATPADDLYSLLGRMDREGVPWAGYPLTLPERQFYSQKDLMAAFYAMKHHHHQTNPLHG